MKNLKNTVAAFGLMAVMGFGAVSANAGLMVSDKSGQGCGAVKADLFTQLSGILIVGVPMLNGLLVSDRSGLLVSDRSGLLVSDKASGGACGKTGLMVSDRSGLMVSDRSGLLVSD